MLDCNKFYSCQINLIESEGFREGLQLSYFSIDGGHPEVLLLMTLARNTELGNRLSS